MSSYTVLYHQFPVYLERLAFISEWARICAHSTHLDHIILVPKE